MDTAKAGGRARVDRGIVDQAAGDDGVVAANGEGEVGQLRRAVKCVATGRLVVGGAGDLLVVGSNNVVGEEHQGGSGVSDTLDRAAGAATGFVAICSEHPETLRTVDGSVG